MSRVEVLITSRCAQSRHLRLDKISVLQFEPRMIFGKVCAGSALKIVWQLTGRPLRYCHVLKETSWVSYQDRFRCKIKPSSIF
jgi:hypothetical protein